MAGNSSIFLERTVTGLESTMAKFYAKTSRCQVGLTSELSRLLLPLAWLVRVRGDDASRTWLRDVADALLAYWARTCLASWARAARKARRGRAPRRARRRWAVRAATTAS